jgi:hypothetical protein
MRYRGTGRTVPGCLFALALLVGGSSIAGRADATPCGTRFYPFPFTDVAGVTDPFCPGIMEAYVTGVSRGTSATTFSPGANVDRTQMTTFLQRSLDQGLRRGSRRAALGQWWTSGDVAAMQSVALASPFSCVSDGDSVWVRDSGSVTRVQASTGKVLGAWTGATGAGSLLAAAGKVLALSDLATRKLYVLDPTLPPGSVSVAAENVGALNVAFDGARLWTTWGANAVSIITPQASMPYPVTTVNVGPPATATVGIAFDGANIWVTDANNASLLKLDALGNVTQTVAVGINPVHAIYDGANIWTTNRAGNSVTVVQASTGAVVATLDTNASNNLVNPLGAAFDGERVLVSSFDAVTVFKAADLSVIRSVPVSQGFFPCSDGIDFWIPRPNAGALLRF